MPRNWIDAQLRRRGITDERVLEAMRRVPRELFVPPESRHRADADAALALSHGQTISQPFIVALIAQALELDGDERVPELAARARENLRAAGYDVDVVVGDGSQGLAERAPFDGIAVAASAERVPAALVEQLEPDGILVLPVGEQLVAVTHTRLRVLSPARFVPLVTGFPDGEAEITGPS